MWVKMWIETGSGISGPRFFFFVETFQTDGCEPPSFKSAVGAVEQRRTPNIHIEGIPRRCYNR